MPPAIPPLQPRILGSAQERLTNVIADVYSRTNGWAQEWARLMLTTVGRGGNAQVGAPVQPAPVPRSGCPPPILAHRAGAKDVCKEEAHRLGHGRMHATLLWPPVLGSRWPA